MEETRGKKKRLLQDLRDKPITQDQLAALLDVTPRAINEMPKRGVLPEPSAGYPVAWTDRKVILGLHTHRRTSKIPIQESFERIQSAALSF